MTDQPQPVDPPTGNDPAAWSAYNAARAGAAEREIERLRRELAEAHEQNHEMAHALFKAQVAVSVARTDLADAEAALGRVQAIADEAEADIPEDAGNATAHLIAKRLRAAIAGAGNPNQPAEADANEWECVCGHKLTKHGNLDHSAARRTGACRWCACEQFTKAGSVPLPATTPEPDCAECGQPRNVHIGKPPGLGDHWYRPASTEPTEQEPKLVWQCMRCRRDLVGNPNQCPGCGYTVYRPTWPEPTEQEQR